MSKPKIKRLFFDIETAPNVGLFWESGYQVNVPYENVIKERAIICIAWKWAGEKTVHSLNWNEKQDDKEMLVNFIDVLNKADEIVAHNGNSFDIKWVRTRCLYHGIPVIPNYITIDTCKIAQSRFRFNSSSLDYLSQFLGLGKKIETKFDLWKKVLLDNDRKSLAYMVKYCKNDVALLEKVWDKLNTYVEPTSNFADYSHHCPECNSKNVIVNKRRVTAVGYKKITFRCSDCGKYHTMAESKFMKGKQI